MTKDEINLYKQIRNVPSEVFLNAARVAMSAAAEKKFHSENVARNASIARHKPVHDAMRGVIEKSADFRAVKQALVATRLRPQKLELEKPYSPVGPKAPRLRLGSLHLVDTPPFQALTWQNVQTFGGMSDPPSSITPPVADGTTGDMTFSCLGGGYTAVSNCSSVSCWCAIGQTYTMDPALAKIETGGAMLRFSASPSFSWIAKWTSNLYQLASGNIWIGQVVNQFDQSGALIGTPVSYQLPLESWNDYNLSDFQLNGDLATSFGLSTWVFVQPNFVYNAWVWIGATAFGDTLNNPGWSFSNAFMNANVSSLIFDTF